MVATSSSSASIVVLVAVFVVVAIAHRREIMAWARYLWCGAYQWTSTPPPVAMASSMN
jgi:hypothetical protein